MSRLRVAGFTISVDGYGAGPRQSREEPLGIGGESLHEWMFPTRTFMRMQGRADGSTGIDDEFVASDMAGNGAWILGRNMFGPIRGPWLDESWRGWWGKNPPYHTPVFVLTNYPRQTLTMEGGTEFRFVTGGIHAALEQALDVAGDKDVRLLGGVSTIRQYLQARLVDEMHLAISPMLLGSGEHLFGGLDLLALGYTCRKQVFGEKATHIIISKRT